MALFLRQVVVFVTIYLVSGSLLGGDVVREFAGNGNTTTAAFEVRAPWLLDWRVNGEYTSLMGFEIDLIDARTGLHAGQVLRTKRKGNGVKLFSESGRYRLRITSSLAKWQIKIEEISREEAKSYTPRGN
ncbi:MAG: hypothetical protein BMS9Abin32_114 [Gammaproteobacteria bacterium]|nr:MAG: hypothetical protein BMS9Abin32_114 [Gammaproteobacteria bacterium]